MTVEDGPPTLSDGVVTLRAPETDGARLVDLIGGQGEDSVVFAVEAQGELAGAVKLRDIGDRTGDVRWALFPSHRGRGYATRAVGLLVDYAFAEPPRGLGLGRVEARVEPGDTRSVRIARRTGLRNEGVVRGARTHGRDYALLGRLRDDPLPTERGGFRALLNSFLPRKRVIAQALVLDTAGRVLLCHLTYKDDWDLPGGVVEGMESPRQAAGREVLEELGLVVPVGRLVLTDWLPPWGGWDDALCLVYDGGSHDPGVLDQAVFQAREIRKAEFLTADQVRDRAADFTARRVQAALAALRGDGPAYTESGRPVD